MIRLILALGALGAEPTERVGRLVDPALKEASGIVASRRHPDVFWVHNDSGNAAEVFAVRRDGTLIRRYPVLAPALDWEDIATDDAGTLYIADTGNNALNLPIRTVYEVREPDPFEKLTGPIRPLPVVAAHHYTFPAGRRFDAEGLAIWGGEALLVTKRRDGQPAEVYRLPLQPVASVLKPAIPFRVGILDNCNEPATGASLTRDGRTLAVATDKRVRVFETDFVSGWTPVGSMEHHAADVEGITWDGTNLLLVSEDRSIYRVPEARWRSQRGTKR